MAVFSSSQAAPSPGSEAPAGLGAFGTCALGNSGSAAFKPCDTGQAVISEAELLHL